MKLTLFETQLATKRLAEIYDRTNPIISRMYHRSDVTCRPGCAACCTQLIILTIPEGYMLADNIVSRCAESEVEEMKRLLDARIEKHFPDPASAPGNTEYFNRKLPCVLLDVDNRCSAYNARPIGCRYHFAVSDPVNCAPSADGQVLPTMLLNLEPYKNQAYLVGLTMEQALVTVPQEQIPEELQRKDGKSQPVGVGAPMDVMLWWMLILRTEGGKAFGKKYSDARYAKRRLEVWMPWMLAIKESKSIRKVAVSES